MSRIKTIFQNHKKLCLSLAVVLIVLLGIALIYKNTAINSSAHQTSTDTQDPAPRINLEGPTDKEQASGDTAKTQILDEEEARNNAPKPTGQKRSVTPVISYADHINPQGGGQVEVGAYVGEVFEDGGTCTLVLTKGTETRTVTVGAIKNSRSVDCPVMAIAKSSLATGMWQATVKYQSASSEGTSGPRQVNVRDEAPL